MPISEILHDPYGPDVPFVHTPTERSPRDPLEGEPVLVAFQTRPATPAARAWVEGRTEDVLAREAPGRFRVPARLQSTADGWTTWEAQIGAFRAGSRVSYTIFAVEGEGPERSSPGHEFTVPFPFEAGEGRLIPDDHDALWLVHLLRWPALASPAPRPRWLLWRAEKKARDSGAEMRLHLWGMADELPPTLSHHLEATPAGYSASPATASRSLPAWPAPSITVRTVSGTWLPADSGAGAREHGIARPSGEMPFSLGVTLHLQRRDRSDTRPLRFGGFGERFDGLWRAEGIVECHVFEEHGIQRDRTYLPMPWAFTDAGHALLAQTDAPTRWTLVPEEGGARVRIESFNGGEPLPPFTLALSETDPFAFLARLLRDQGRPPSPPSWVFGPWLSANEWNSQAKAERVLDRVTELDLPSTVLVLEAWSDETTFQVFRGSRLGPGEAPSLDSPGVTTPEDPWTDPRALVERARRLGIHVLLWQIPVIKWVPEDEVQALEAGSDRLALARNRWLWDEALQRGYVLRTRGGEPYRIAEGRWFAGSLVLDLTNPEAVAWWLDQRNYLLEELGIDGFKTDGGDHFLTRDAVGQKQSGWALRNTYPDRWAEAYVRWMEERGRPAVTFSRAGYLRSPQLSIHWGGDQLSTFEAFRSVVSAGLTASASGIYLWGFDLGGFAGDLPTPDLYKRSLGVALFSPIMQFHSGAPGDPQPSAERSPWNMAEVWKRPDLVETYRSLARLRMRLIPYIQNELQHSWETGRPLQLALAYAHPDDVDPARPEGLGYWFGREFVIFPVTEPDQSRWPIWLPPGEWVDVWDPRRVIPGGTHVADVRSITVPAYCRADAAKKYLGL